MTGVDSDDIGRDPQKLKMTGDLREMTQNTAPEKLVLVSS